MAAGRRALTVLLVTGPAGSGKSTVARAVADRLGWEFGEGDDLHLAANIAAMRAGRPLTDTDRAPWLAAVAAWIDARLAADRSAVLTCSALKRAYRDQLQRPGLVMVYLAVDLATLERRLTARRGHFLPPAMLRSQLRDLEPPAIAEQVVTIDANRDLPAIVDEIVDEIAAEIAVRAQSNGADASSQDTKPV